MNATNSTTQTTSVRPPSNSGNTAYGFGWHNYMYMLITTFGMLTNSVNICVFLQVKINDVRYKFMLWKSIANLVYLMLLLIYEFLGNCINCPSTNLYFSVFYNIYITTYLSSCIAMFRILVELVLSLNTFSILIRRNWFAKTAPKVVLFIIIMICVSFYSPRLAAYKILNEPQTDIYFIGLTNFGQSNAFKAISTIQSFVRTFFNVIVLGVINFFTLIQFRRWLKSRRVDFALNQFNALQFGINYNSRRNSKPTQKFTKMILFLSFSHMVGELPFLAFFNLGMFGITNPVIVQLTRVTVVFLFLSPALDILIYAIFNRHYRTSFRDCFARLERFACCYK